MTRTAEQGHRPPAQEVGKAAYARSPGHALTVWQPWASLIVKGLKPFEFRRWPAPNWLVGLRLAIHAGSRLPSPCEIQTVFQTPHGTCRDGDPERIRDFLASVLSGRETLVRGAIIGTAVLGRPCRAIELALAAEELEIIDEDVWAWPMLDPEPFDLPCPARGRQGFWRWDHQSL